MYERLFLPLSLSFSLSSSHQDNFPLFQARQRVLSRSNADLRTRGSTLHKAGREGRFDRITIAAWGCLVRTPSAFLLPCDSLLLKRAPGLRPMRERKDTCKCRRGLDYQQGVSKTAAHTPYRVDRQTSRTQKLSSRFLAFAIINSEADHLPLPSFKSRHCRWKPFRCRPNQPRRCCRYSDSKRRRKTKNRVRGNKKIETHAVAPDDGCNQASVLSYRI